MNRFAKLWWTAKGVGWDNLPRRLLQAWRVRSGWLRRRLDPANFSEAAFSAECDSRLEDQPSLWAGRARRLFPVASAGALARAADAAAWDDRVTRVAGSALAGEYLFFSHGYARLGWPPDFHLDPVGGVRWPVGEHWLGGPDSLASGRDIKLVWEASRFSLGYYFARSYARTGEARWAQAFWEMFDAWVRQNPPQLSAGWRCGQEMTFRLMAMLFAATVTLGSAAATDERLRALSLLAWRTARQIDVNLNQARMQKNNHAIGEAAGLWTVGVLFPEFGQAGRWRRRGRGTLAAEAARQIYDDGSYVQHSLNYHRVMMDDLLWAIRLGEINGDPLPPVVLERFERAADWLAEMVDPDTGGVPNYGANDGALVLPLSTCPYADFRPVAQAAHYLLHRRRCFQPGPWDEKMLWLFGPDALDAPVRRRARRASFAAPDGGYYVLRGPDSRAMTRCHSYRDRPSQADLLHLDLWLGGHNVLRDGGTYMYNCAEPWQSYFASTAAHNTLEIDGRDQMTKGPRFLWFHWPRSRLLRFETSGDERVGFFQGEHYGYRRRAGRVVHRRSVCRIDDAYVVIDDVLGVGRHQVAIRWRLCPADWQRVGAACRAEIAGRQVDIVLCAPETMRGEIHIGREGPPPEGWESWHYGVKEAVPALIARGQAALPLRLLTVAGPTARVQRLVEAVRFAPAPGSAVGLSPPEGAELGEAVRRLSGGMICFDRLA